MVKKLFVCCLVVFVLLTTVVAINAADNKIKSQNNAKFLSKAKPAKDFSKLPRFDSKMAADPTIFSDDFEGTMEGWVIDATWNHVDAPGGGRAYQPISSWELTETNSNSPTHSWHAPLGLDQELDFVISPVIHLPMEVETDGAASELKGLKLGYWLDVDTPEGANSWGHLIGSAECWWGLTDADPGAGVSSWLLEPHDVAHWRQWLTTPDIALTGATNLTFKHKYNSELEFDYYGVEISVDNFLSYETLGFWDGTTAQTAWVDETFDLAAYDGQTVKIRFSSKGDYGTAEGFWGVDEILVSDGTTDFFYDDGGEAGTTTMTMAGFAPGDIFSGYTADGASQADPAWQEMAPMPVPGFGNRILPGDSIRIAFQWDSDGTATTGRGLFIDDVTLYGVGLLGTDVEALGAVGFENAVVGKKLNLGVVAANVGLNSLTGVLQWNGELLHIAGEDTTVAQPAMFGRMDVADFVRDTKVTVGTNPARQWVVDRPGDYLFRGVLNFDGDLDAKNNSFAIDFTVFGPPMMNVLYREDFEPLGGQGSLDDFGFMVENGGGCEATGLNDNKWEYIGFIYGDGAATLSAFWGACDPGSDAVAPWDSSEVLDEGIITPEVDISGLGKHATLFMNYYIYWRAGYGSYTPYGEQWNDFTVEFTIDGGETWHEGFIWTDYDSLAGTGWRLPNFYYGPDAPQLSYASHLGIDLTKAVVMGGETLQVRFKVWSENSYFVAASVDNIVIYSGVDHARILSINDIPMDQGKQVQVTWEGSFNDLTLWTEGMYGEYESHIVTHYNLWRQKTIFGQLEKDFIATIPAHQDRLYNYVAPTLWDGVEAMFMVSAHADDPMIFVDSEWFGGTSTDDLAPAPPMNLFVSGENGNNVLNWDASPAEDLRYYAVYRSETSGSYGSEAYAYTTDLTFIDEDATFGTTYYYMVTATDFALNEGERSNEASIATSVNRNNGKGIPDDFALGQNYPNPFNPTTHISYQLPTNAHVTIAVFNTNGQEIKTLVDKEMNTGYHNTIWDGTNNAGETVSSGLYIYKIKAGNFTDIKKMMLLQ